jgi:uracil-DNA glycosylase
MNQKQFLELLADLKNAIYQEQRYTVVEKSIPEKKTFQTKHPGVYTSHDADERRERYESFRTDALGCTKCNLHQTRRNVVFGDGDWEHAQIVFIGEAPGAEEDNQGIPFVGRAGQLLTRFINAVMLDRSTVYICNILKCRPPGNNDPLPEQIESCTPHLVKQIKLIDPKIIVTLGRFATQFILETTEGISKLRGVPHEKDGRYVFPTFHPSALLRRASLKIDVWDDIRKLRSLMDKMNL